MDKIRVNKSAERVVDLLVLLSKSSSPLTLNEICKELGLPKSSAFELVQTLLYKGFIELDDARLKTYRLGLGIFETGMAYVSNLGIPHLARPLLQELNRQTGSTVFLGIEDKGKVVYLDKAESYSVMRPTAKLGSRRYIHTTGLGKALLAAMPDDKVQHILGDSELPARTSYSKVTIPDLLQDLRAIRERGYSIDDREDNLEMYCIASAIYDQWNHPVAAISVASMYSGMNPEREQMIVRLVQEAALKLSNQLGYSGHRLYPNQI
ncbi:IclR family transcriptional regulator [Paenibacillus sp. PsM32]|uniref:IclR family transcriptional regulator n=1 Tax=unclassified Paenibacillus TaxID=185978 RepID=UPI00263B924B|nr:MULTISPECIES: IclR family transcriptional regulator [unclassified Paenibacillus]MDN4618626.1 IclR family transcriptional regulator [Paenibacillus sp. PsM32]MDQ1236352.1 DNA-binding IclR family transcriptional regulator [Paenibacillus sp. SORGH_AS_0306]MDR6108706.1 DNA-binding IclR family transcriptional regulator [Paenibacillus sp. SORGH_AS_0338]